MHYKKFSITKAFEFAFDMLVHHHIVFLQYALIVGGLSWGSWCVNKYYLKPYIKRGVIIVQHHIFETKTAQGIQKEYPEINNFRKALNVFLSNDFMIRPAVNARKIVGISAFDQVHKKMIVKEPVLVSHWRPLNAHEKHALALSVVCYIISYVMSVFIALLSLRLAIDIYSFHTINIPYSFNLTLRLLPMSILAWLLLDVISSLGLLFLIIPGIILYLRHSQIIVLLADHRAVSITEAFRMSAECTQGAKWYLALLSLIIMGITRWSAYTGWLYLITAPCIALIMVHVYYQLLEQTPEVLAQGHCEATIER